MHQVVHLWYQWAIIEVRELSEKVLHKHCYMCNLLGSGSWSKHIVYYIQ